MRLAAAAYPLDAFDTWDALVAKWTAWVEDAVSGGADLLVFPEYGAMELAALDGAAVAGDLEASLTSAAARLSDMQDVFAGLAVARGVHILTPSGPAWPDGAARPVNRAVLCTPDGTRGYQDKQIMTRFERETWDVTAGDSLQVFETRLGRIGVLICYDSEFPLLARALIEGGVDILLVPSCTDTLAGYWRVRVGAMARALEGQCVVVQSPTVGDAPWSPAVDENVGAAAIYGPPDLGFPPTGVLAEGTLNAPGWVMGDVTLDQIRAVRDGGHVFNRAHWPEQENRTQTVTSRRLF